MRFHKTGEQKERLSAVSVYELRRFAGYKHIQMVFWFEFRGYAVKVPSLDVPDPGAAFWPQAVYVRQAGAAVIYRFKKVLPHRMVGDFVGVVLYLRTEVHQPIVDGHIVLEAVIMGIYEVHLTYQGGQIAVFGEMMGHRSVSPVKLVGVGDCAGAVCVQTG